MLGFLHDVDSRPLESNSHPVVDSGTGTSAAQAGEQILPVMSSENASVPGPTSDEAHGGRSVNQSSRIPEATSQMLSQSSSGTSRPLNASSLVPLGGQGAGAPDISTPPETPQLEIESPAHTRNESISQNMAQTLLHEVVPEKGPTTGGICVALFGENIPAVPLYVCFGEKWVRAVSDV